MALFNKALGFSFFGGRFLFKNLHINTDPDFAIKLREPYANKYGPYGDNFIRSFGTVRWLLIFFIATCSI